MKYPATILLFLAGLKSMSAQATNSFNQNGKFNVVFTVIFIVFAGIIFYLIRIDRKISKLENK